MCYVWCLVSARPACLACDGVLLRTPKANLRHLLHPSNVNLLFPGKLRENSTEGSRPAASPRVAEGSAQPNSHRRAPQFAHLCNVWRSAGSGGRLLCFESLLGSRLKLATQASVRCPPVESAPSSAQSCSCCFNSHAGRDISSSPHESSSEWEHRLRLDFVGRQGVTRNRARRGRSCFTSKGKL